MNRRAAAAVALGLLLGGCAAPTPEGPMSTSTPGPLPQGPVPDAVTARPDVRAAIAAEALRRGVSPDQVEVAGYADVTWPDSSIGCPQPGMQYAQALQPGRRVVLRVGGELASYHAAGDGPFTFCPSPTEALPAESDPRR